MPRIPPGMNSPKGADGTSESPDVEAAPGNGSHDIASGFHQRKRALSMSRDGKWVARPSSTPERPDRLLALDREQLQRGLTTVYGGAQA